MKRVLNRILWYFNPIRHLGDRKYPVFFPFFTLITITVLLEAYAYYLLKNPEAVGLYAIFVYIALIVYFAFRSGIRGGLIVVVLTMAYYFYIIYSRQYTGQRLSSGIETTVILGVIYLLIAGIIGWLKQTVDKLIEAEANERRRLQAILQQLPTGVIITDNRGKVVQSNKQVEKMIGRKIPKGYVIGKDKPIVESQYNGKTATPSHSPLAQALSTGKAVVGREFIANNKGKKVYMQVSASPIHNSKGDIIAAASIINDITALREMEERKDDFLNMASHELKTPITSMKLYLELLARQSKTHGDPKASKLLKSVTAQTDRLQKLVNDLLDVSRLQTGKLTFAKEQFRLDILAKETIGILQGTAEKNRIIFSNKQPANVYADRFRIYQVITNLITNAVKYSTDGQPIKVSLKMADKKAILSVADRGIGIAKEEQKKIFDRLYQVTDEAGKTFPGFGMGLYISSEIVKRHRGKIWVESERGHGSTFYFTLPTSK